MNEAVNEPRRRLLGRLALAIVVLPLAGKLASAAAADAPLVSADDPTAKALKYVDSAAKSPDAKPGNSCASCRLYQGAAGSAQGGCLLFPGKSVKAGGWCASWTAKA
jgi:hypothetical protein